MNIVAWIVFGLITGLIANIIDPYPEKGGLIGAALLGVAGSVLGGILGNIVFGVGLTGFNFASFSVAVLGSLLLLLVRRAFGKV